MSGAGGGAGRATVECHSSSPNVPESGVPGRRPMGLTSETAFVNKGTGTVWAGPQGGEGGQCGSGQWEGSPFHHTFLAVLSSRREGQKQKQTLLAKWQLS